MQIRSIALNIVAGAVIVVVAFSLFSVSGEPRWATLSEFHVHWDVYTNTVEASVVIDKHQKCRRVVVTKNLNPLIKDDVMPVDVPLNGKLSAKFMEAPLGTSILFDRAKPRVQLSPGQYVITLVASCEADETPAPNGEVPLPTPPLADPTVVQPSPRLLATKPIQALIVVPKIPIRMIEPQ